MSRLALFSNSIHQRFLAVALIPLLLITVLLTTYTVETRQGDITDNLYDAGEMAAVYLATISDFALYSSNADMLSTTAASVTRLPDVQGVAYFNQKNEPVIATDNFPEQSTPPGATDAQYLYFRKPIYLSGVDFTDYQEESTDNTDDTELVGWVVVAMDQSGVALKQREILISTLGLALWGFLVLVVMTYYLSRSIISPIQKLTRVVKTLEQGDLVARAEIDTNDELASLATGINRLAESVAEGRENLEFKVGEATRQLQKTLSNLQQKNSELEVATREAEAANQAKGEFLARMSHELRTPITSVQGFVRLLDNQSLSDTDRHYCHIINQASSQLLTLIDDILVFSKLQANTVVLENRPFDLADSVEQATAQFIPQAIEKGLELVLDFDPDLSLYRIGDSARIRQIVSNLISNAVKFTLTGGVSIRVFPSDHQSLVIRIKDTGIGIPKEDQGQLFNAFTQADTSISRRYGGTGLGLSIVKTMVEVMGGQVELHSGRGEGAEFLITLPLPVAGEDPQWEGIEKTVILCSPSETSAKSLVHVLQRFSCTPGICSSLDQLILDPLLSKADAILLCPAEVTTKEEHIPEKILALRGSTSAHLIIIARILNFYQQFTPEQITKLQPATFLTTPPTMADLHGALVCSHKSASIFNRVEELQSSPKPLNKLCILVAEDNQFTRLLLQTLLSEMGATAELVENGEEAIAACENNCYDLLLVDVHMPVKNGIETIRELRSSDSPNANIPIIALTADVLQQEEKALAEAGSNTLLIKPLDENLLLETICTLTGIQPPDDERESLDIEQHLSADLFKQEIKSQLDAVRTAFEGDHPGKARNHIHQLLGIAGVFRMEQLEKQVRRLHSTVKEAKYDQVVQILDQIEQELDSFVV